MHQKSYLLILSIILLVTLTGCSLPWQKKGSTTVSPTNNQVATTTSVESLNSADTLGGLKEFKDLEELQAFLSQHADSGNSALIKNKDLAVDLATTETTAALGSGESRTNQAIPVATNYSQTNIQVEGVDEADIIKTDGSYVYLLDYNDLYIIKAKPAGEAAVKTKITFKSRPQEFYISGDRLIVFGYDNQIYNDKTYQSFKRQSSYTYLKVFDISDVTNPKQIRDLDLEGSYNNSRLVGNYLYFVTDNYQNYQLGEPLLPRVLDGGQVLPEKCNLAAKCYAPDVFYFNIPYQSYNFTSVMAINVKNASEAPTGNIYLLSGNQNMYVSPAHIYITYTEYLDEVTVEREVTTSLVRPQLSVDNQDRIAKIEAVDSFILSTEEKQAKIYNIIQAYISDLTSAEETSLQTKIDTLLKQTLEAKAKEMEKTVIHKLAFNGAKLEYKATGAVPGYVLNQFSMDENNNYFRIATTRSQSWSRLEAANKDSYSNVYVLDDKLVPVGALENLAVGEKIYSARFMGDRAYLVTYKQTDPLFAIDLRNPKAPQVLGELKIPGYSTYLHPYAGNLLLGFGRDTEINSSGGVINKGLKLGLFDITNAKAPRELDSFVIGDKYSDSIALSDYKAFLISSEKNLVVLPATLRTGNYGDKLEFSGALVFGITGNKIKLRGRIDHSDSGNYINRDFWTGISYYDNSVKRSLFIDDALYTFSNKFLKINNLKSSGDTLPLLKSIDLLPNVGKDFEVKPVSSGPTVSTTPAVPILSVSTSTNDSTSTAATN